MELWRAMIDSEPGFSMSRKRDKNSTKPGPEMEVLTPERMREIVKDRIFRFLDLLSDDRLIEIAKDVRILERAILLTSESEPDKFIDMRSISSGRFNDVSTQRLKLLEEVKKTAAGILSTASDANLDLLLRDSENLLHYLKNGYYLTKELK